MYMIYIILIFSLNVAYFLKNIIAHYYFLHFKVLSQYIWYIPTQCCIFKKNYCSLLLFSAFQGASQYRYMIYLYSLNVVYFLKNIIVHYYYFAFQGAIPASRPLYHIPLPLLSHICLFGVPCARSPPPTYNTFIHFGLGFFLPAAASHHIGQPQ